MNIDNELINCIIRDGESSFITAKRMVRPYMVEGAASSAYHFINEYFDKNGELPTKEFLWAKAGFDTKETKEKIEVVSSEISDRYLWKQEKTFSDLFVKLIENKKPRQAFDELGKFANNVADDLPSNVIELYNVGEDVLEFYYRAKEGIVGAKTPWPSLNDGIIGLIKREVNIFVSRSGIGKTYLMLLLARYAFLQGHKILFVCTEMDKTNIATRFFGIEFGLEPRDIRRGSLNESQEMNLVQNIRNREKKDGFGLLADDVKTTIEEVENSILSYKPDIVFVDGLYLLSTSMKGDRHAKVSHIADQLTRIAKQRNVSINASHQFNRDVDPDDPDSADIRSLGISDVIGWNATNVYALFQTTDMKDDNEMMFIPMKLRGGEAKRFLTNWNFDQMDFSEFRTEDSDFKDEGFNNDFSGDDPFGDYTNDDSNDLPF